MASEKANPFNGIAAAGLVSGVDAIHRNVRLQRAIQIREMAKVLGIPPAKLEEEMLAGGNITVNERGALGPWIFATVLVLASLGVLGGWAWWWGVPHRPSPPIQSSDYRIEPGTW